MTRKLLKVMVASAAILLSGQAFAGACEAEDTALGNAYASLSAARTTSDINSALGAISSASIALNQCLANYYMK